VVLHTKDDNISQNKTVSLLGLIFTLTYALLITLNRLYIGYISNRMSALNNTFFLNLGVAFLGTILGCLDPNRFIWPDLTSNNTGPYLLLLVNCISSFLVQYMIVLAMKYEKDTSKANLIVNGQIVFSWLIDILLLGTDFDFVTFLGALVVVSSGYWVITSK
jgi:drug/metabolite transporter (DMT)-like permease